ncbi:MAG: hypothetical protein FJW31_27515 [Acidobacteria bacterium]|nr:hypothetical protein [Acidobacteriota bacterium]
MGIPLVAGREFTAADNRAGGRLAIVNESFARQFFGGRDPIGRQFGPANQPPNITIAGVVRDGKYADLQERSRPVF